MSEPGTGPATPPQESPVDEPTGAAPVDQLVDWNLAVRTAGAVAGKGPTIPLAAAAQAVADLRDAAARAGAHVTRVTGLSAPTTSGVLVVDRAGWARANADVFRTLLEPVVAESFSRRPGGQSQPAAVVAVGSRVAGAEVGALLGFLASRVLGQYDPFAEPGRLLLVAPNVVTAETELDVPPADFRLWVCLHEETHRVQFDANPWLAPHLLGRIRSLSGGMLGVGTDPSRIAERAGQALRSLPDLVRGPQQGSSPLLDLVSSPEQRRSLAELTAVMSLLEGHADVVMDAVGPDVVPSVEVIRQRFTQRRSGRGVLDRALRRLLGLDAKMRQYADGARFVREVTSRVGVEGMNAVWQGPETLPLPEEIADPGLWVARLHG